MMHLTFLTAALAVAFQQGAPAQAQQNQPDLINPDRPGIADGSTVLGPKRFQVETGILYQEQNPQGQKTRSIFVPLLLRYGVSNKVEARFEVPTGAYGIADLSDSRTAGYTPVSFGVKYHFQDQDGMKKPSLGTIARVYPPSGSGPFSSTKTQADIRLAADLDIAPKSLFEINPNVGVATYTGPDGNNFTAFLAAFTLNYNPTDHLNFFADAGLQSPEQPHGKNALIVDFGTAIIVGNNLQWDFSVGFGATGQFVPHPFLAGGVSIRY